MAPVFRRRRARRSSRIAPTLVVLILGFGVLLDACRSTPSSEEAGKSALSAPGPAPTIEARSLDASAGPTDASADAAAGAGELPPVDDHCTRDDECGVVYFEVTGERACCPACATVAGRREWVTTVREACFRGVIGKPCPPLACPLGPTTGTCEGGHCKATAFRPDGGGGFDVPLCLPSAVCNGTFGCTAVVGSDQNGFLVTRQPSRPEVEGKIAPVGDVCFGKGASRKCVRAVQLPIPCTSGPPEQVPLAPCAPAACAPR